MLLPLLLNNLLGSSASAVTTGTAVSGLTEAQIVAGGETIIITLTGDTWVAAGTGPVGSIADTQALIDGISAAESETTGWNAEVRDKEIVGSVVRTSNTVVTITLSAAPAYDVTANETISIIIPAATLTGAQVIGSSPGITVTADPAVVTEVEGGGWPAPRKRKPKREWVREQAQELEIVEVKPEPKEKRKPGRPFITPVFSAEELKTIKTKAASDLLNRLRESQADLLARKQQEDVDIAYLAAELEKAVKTRKDNDMAIVMMMLMAA